MRILILLSCILLLSACANLPGYRYPVGRTPPPEVSVVILNRPITVRADRASEYIQDGEVKHYNKVQEYYPHCIFELRIPSGSERTVLPDTFTVISIRRDRFMAWAAGRMLALGGDNGDYNMVMSSTVLSLHSDRQPEVFRLTCQQLDEPYHAHHLTAEEMQKTLGTLIALH
jgi:hypothetical protein